MRSFSKEHREKLSKSHIGQKGYWTGKKRVPTSAYQKQRASEASKGHKRNIGRIPWNKGIKTGSLSEEHKQKISKAISTIFRKRPTKIETIVYEELEKRNIQFEKQYSIGHFVVDTYIHSLNLIIEIDGVYWHNLENIKKRDKARNAYFIKCGYRLVRLEEEKIHSGEFKSILKKEGIICA